ncbi:MAG: ribosome rescue protein RqcH [Candidatus Nanohaloarchaea archaeon]|nr:ribosome rescue protein RqcH [Candidatus Nanohaloarchaea archaeon]
MPDSISSLDLVALMREFAVLEGARIDKVYQRDDELTVHIYKPGDKKYRLFIAPGKAFLTDYKRDNPQKPPNFCMELRKHLGGQRIERIEQHGFDRVLVIHTDEQKLVAELFGQGNVLLVDKGTDEIKAVMQSQEWSDRALYRGEEYEYPEPGPDPASMGLDAFSEQLGTRQIVKVLAADIGLGGMYAEEILARTDIDKDTRSETLDDSQRQELHRTMQSFVEAFSSGELSPRIYYRDGDPATAAPVELATYQDAEAETYDSFSTALDTYFTEKQKAEYRKKKLKAYREKKEKLERQKQQQEQMLQGMKASIDEKKELGDLIYEHYGTIEELIDTLRKARKNYSESEIRERLESEKANGVREAQIVEDINLAEGQVVIDLGRDTVTIDIDEGVEKNAERYYQKSKEAKRKVEGAKEALEETKRELEQLGKPEDIDVEDAFTNKEEKRQKKRWYEKFRWFYSSDGFLVVGGKDQTSNDVLVKKHMQKHDRYVHADFEGAPSVVVKNPDQEEIPEQTLEEAAQLAIGYSKAWKMNIAADDAYHVAPDQVTKEPESGEYLAKGAFVIRGDRDYIRNVEVSAAVGAYERDGQWLPMGGPLSAVTAHCDHYVEVKQGGTKKSDVTKQIQRHLHDATGEDFDQDKIMRALPPGTCSIKDKV